MASLNTREQFLICAVMLLACGFLLYRFVVSPELKHVSAARFHLNSQQNLLEMRAEEIQHRNVLNDKVRQLKMSIAETGGLLFSRDEAMDFLELLPQLISQTGSVLMTMEPREMAHPRVRGNGAAAQQTKQEQRVSEMQVERAYMSMPVQVAVRGKYSGIIRFFEQLEERKQLVTSSEINIATAEDAPAEVDAQLTLNLYVYEHQQI